MDFSDKKSESAHDSLADEAMSLAFDCSQSAGGEVALLQGCRVLAAKRLPLDMRSAVTLAPTIQLLLAEHLGQMQVQLIGVVRGPGSFTGIRIGITTAKMLSYTWQVPVVGVLATDCLALQTAAAAWQADLANAKLELDSTSDGTFDGNATNAPTASGYKISVAIDAHRQQVFTADYLYEPATQTLRTTRATGLQNIAQWLAELPPDSWACGPALEKLASQLPANVRAAPREAWTPRATTAGILACYAHRAGKHDDPFQLSPLYLRPSYAEEKRK